MLSKATVLLFFSIQQGPGGCAFNSSCVSLRGAIGLSTWPVHMRPRHPSSPPMTLHLASAIQPALENECADLQARLRQACNAARPHDTLHVHEDLRHWHENSTEHKAASYLLRCSAARSAPATMQPQPRASGAGLSALTWLLSARSAALAHGFLCRRHCTI